MPYGKHNPESCLYLHTTHEAHTISPTPRLPWWWCRIPPSLPGSFAEPGHGDPGRDHHNIVFKGTTQKKLFIFWHDCIRAWLCYNILHYYKKRILHVFLIILSSEFQFKTWQYRTMCRNTEQHDWICKNTEQSKMIECRSYNNINNLSVGKLITCFKIQTTQIHTTTIKVILRYSFRNTEL